MKQIDHKTIDLNGNKIEFPERIKKLFEFDRSIVVFILAIPGDPEFNLKYSGERIFGINKSTGKIIWKKDGDDIQKVERESKFILLDMSMVDSKQKFDLIINYPSMNAFVDPNTGNVIKYEQTK